MSSFSVRSLFLWHSPSAERKKFLYEERITLWDASCFDEAIQFAEREAESYADQDIQYLNFSQAYELSNQLNSSGVEVFSLLRESDLEPELYLDAFFDTGFERINLKKQ